MQHAHSPHTVPMSFGKNRIPSTLATPALAGGAREYALSPEDGADLFSMKGQAWLAKAISQLPPETGRCLQQEVELLDSFNQRIRALEDRIRQQIELTPSMQLLKTLPGVGDTA